MEISAWLVDADYTTREGKAIIRLWCKDDDGRRIVVFDRSFEPYFYAVGNASIDDIMNIQATRYDEVVRPKRVEVVERKDFGKKTQAFKIIVEHPQHVPSLREAIGALGLDVREADVLFAVRYIIDHDLCPLGGIIAKGEPVDVEYADVALDASEVRAQKMRGNPDLKIMAFDCEMANPSGMPNAEHDPIIIIGVATNRGDVKILSAEDDSALLAEFIDFIHTFDPDIICGYNSDNFDWPYIHQRAKIHDISLKLGKDGSVLQVQGGAIKKVTITGYLNIDLYQVVRRDLDGVKVKTLENVAEYLGVMKKSERVDLSPSEIYQYWEDPTKREKLLEYARSDVISTLGIAEKMLPLQYEFARMIRQPLDEASKMGRGRQVESFLSAEAFKTGELVPSKGGMGETYVGGFVLEPKKGLHENVVCLDFSAMYPSIMISFNISPDTVVRGGDCYEAPEVGHRFRKEPDGFFKRILKDLVGRRNEQKRALGELDKDSSEYQLFDIRQQAIKILTNAFYGYTGWSAARWYRKECAEATTAWGRYFIKKSIKKAEEMGLEVIYGDTDSLFVKAREEDVMELAEKFAQVISKELPLELDIQNLYKVIFFTEKKKRYAGLTSEGEIIVKGLEVRRGDWCALAKDIQANVVQIILQERDPGKAVRLVQDTVQLLKDGKIPLEELVIYKTLTKKISSYESMQAHVRAAKRAKKPIEVGMKIAYVIVRGPGSIGDRAYPVDMFSGYENGYLVGEGRRYEIDSDYYVDNQIIPVVHRILSYFGFSTTELKGQPKQATFDVF
ncbi:MAG: DNA-directed DNA polymerase [Methanocellales archaeon]|nr:DNA-directed DNA polymerase [Methanocellales archaeon]